MGAEFESVGDFGGSESGAFNSDGLQGDGSGVGPGEEKADGPAFFHGMRAEESERIGMTRGEEGVDLSDKARIECSRRDWLQNGAVLGQGHCLRMVMDIRRWASIA